MTITERDVGGNLNEGCLFSLSADWPSVDARRYNIITTFKMVSYMHPSNIIVMLPRFVVVERSVEVIV